MVLGLTNSKLTTMTRLTEDKREFITIILNGYKYFLVKTKPRLGGFPPPCFMGHEGYALYKSKKLNIKNCKK